MSALSFAPIALAQSNSPEIYFVQDAAAQFNQLALRPEPFGFRSPDDFSPTFLDYHYQGIVRKHGTGTPYLFVSRNHDGAGYLLVVRMSSRDRTGERLRSNRLFRDSAIGGVPPFATTLPDARDTTVAVVRFDGTNGWPAYKHPGGMQMVGNILAVPLSQPGRISGQSGRVHQCVESGISVHRQPLRSGCARKQRVRRRRGGLDTRPEYSGPGVRYIMLLAGESNKDVRLYRIAADEYRGGLDRPGAP